MGRSNKISDGFHWYRDTQRPPEDVTVRAEIVCGLDGAIALDIYRRGHRWYAQENNQPLPEPMRVVRWRFKTENTMKAGDMTPRGLDEVVRRFR